MSQESITFKLKFETPEKDGQPTHQIDAETLGHSLTELSGLLRNSIKTLKGESATAELDVKANSEGSFVVEFVRLLVCRRNRSVEDSRNNNFSSSNSRGNNL